MRGSNPIRGREVGGHHLQVHEVFATVQGEGPFSGRRAVFIRLTGCCLKCWFCDTEWNDADDPKQSVTEIVLRTRAQALRLRTPDGTAGPAPLVVLTGGEPTNWELAPLIERLQEAGFFAVQIETAGVRWDRAFDLDGVTVVVSPKTPTVAPEYHAQRFGKVFFKYPLSAQEYSTDDGLPVTNTQVAPWAERRVSKLARPSWLATRPEHVFITPLDTGEAEGTLQNVQSCGEIAMRFGYVAQVQLHKTLRLP